MHELSLAEHLLSLVEASAQQEGFRQVHRVVLGIGRFSFVDTDTLLHCIHHQCTGTLLKGATITCDTLYARADCLSCHTDFVPDEWPCACPQCGRVHARLTEGRDMILQSLEVS